MTAELNGLTLINATIDEPLVGAWHAQVEVDTEEAITGEVTIEIDDETWIGTVVRGGMDFRRWRGLVVGGAGGLSTVLDAKYYSQGVTLSAPLDDIMTATGETLSTTVSSSITGHVVARWQRMKGPASRALLAIATEADATWRVLRDGTIWLGTDDWDEADLEEPIVTDEDWAAGRIVLKDAAALLPGQTYDGNQIKRVTHYLVGSTLTTEARTVGDLFDRILDAVRRQTDYHRIWPARVVSQHGDGTLELYPDDEWLRGAGGLNRVPIRHGLPGTTLTVTAGARVRVGFEAGDPKRPYAALWDTDAAFTVIQLGGTTGVARLGDSVDCGELWYLPGGPAQVGMLYYKPPGGAPAVVTPGTLPVPPLAGTGTAVKGEIDSASSVLQTG